MILQKFATFSSSALSSMARETKDGRKAETSETEGGVELTRRWRNPPQNDCDQGCKCDSVVF